MEMIKRQKSKRLQKIAQNNPLVMNVLMAGGTEIDCIEMLVKQNEDIITRISRLEMLVPRKIIVDDKEYIWRCPDELVPSQEELECTNVQNRK